MAWYKKENVSVIISKALAKSSNTVYQQKKLNFYFLITLPVSCYWSLSIPPENIRKILVFWYFQGVQKEISGITELILTYLWLMKMACNSIKKRLQHRCFLVNFAKNSRKLLLAHLRSSIICRNLVKFLASALKISYIFP